MEPGRSRSETMRSIEQLQQELGDISRGVDFPQPRFPTGSEEGQGTSQSAQANAPQGAQTAQAGVNRRAGGYFTQAQGVYHQDQSASSFSQRPRANLAEASSYIPQGVHPGNERPLNQQNPARNAQNGPIRGAQDFRILNNYTQRAVDGQVSPSLERDGQSRISQQNDTQVSPNPQRDGQSRVESQQHDPRGPSVALASSIHAATQPRANYQQAGHQSAAAHQGFVPETLQQRNPRPRPPTPAPFQNQSHVRPPTPAPASREDVAQPTPAAPVSSSKGPIAVQTAPGHLLIAPRSRFRVRHRSPPPGGGQGHVLTNPAAPRSSASRLPEPRSSAASRSPARLQRRTPRQSTGSLSRVTLPVSASAHGSRDHLVPSISDAIPRPPPFQHNWQYPNRRAAAGAVDPRGSRQDGYAGVPVGSRPNPTQTGVSHPGYSPLVAIDDSTRFAYGEVMGPAEAEYAAARLSESGENAGPVATVAIAAEDGPVAAVAGGLVSADLLSPEEAALAYASTQRLTVVIDRGFECHLGAFTGGDDA